MKKNDINKCLLNKDTIIRDALKIIDQGGISIAIVVNELKQVIGTLTDGDIRRAILNGKSLDDSISEHYFRNPTLCNISEPREQIIHKAIEKKLYQIPIVNNEGILIDIEDLTSLLKMKHRPNRVLLMAGGLGTRLHPLTKNIPKPLLKVGNKPILETIIENFSKYGFVNITISVNYKSEMIKEYFGDGLKFGVNITYITEDKRLGTAGALSLLEENPKYPFFVMNADLLTNVNFVHLLDYHLQGNNEATMCVREFDFQVPYGVIEIENEKIISIKEKPIQSFFVNAGIYVLSPKVLKLIPLNEFYDMPTLFENLIQENKNIASFPIHEYWLDIGRMNDYEKAQMEYTEVFCEN